MALFKDMLKDHESLFRDTVALDYDFMPKMVPFREPEQKKMAAAIQPLFSKRNGRNCLLFGAPGIGKTVACKHVLKELEEETDDIIPLYINCWQKNTTFKVMVEICEHIGYKFTQNKKTEELFRIVKENLNKKSVVFVFDEIDKAEDNDFLYSLMEEIYRKSIFLITNYKHWFDTLDERIKSRLTPDFLEFKSYTFDQVKGILKQRMEFAFCEGAFDDAAFVLAAEKAHELSDVRTGLHLLQESGNIAEEESSRAITKEHVEKAIIKLNEFTIKKSEDIEQIQQDILTVIKKNSGKKIGDIHRILEDNGVVINYKTFQRKIEKLAKAKFITCEKISGGTEGKTTIIRFNEVNSTLDSFS